MLKQRLIFTLLYSHGYFNLSRNFNLQKVGDLDWVNENYDFESIAKSIDELVILNVERRNKDIIQFVDSIKLLTKNYFMPIAAGGGISNLDDVYKIFDAGAEKVVINTCLFEKPKLVESISKRFGEQSIIASIDFLREANDTYYSDIISNDSYENINLPNIVIMTRNGKNKLNLNHKETIDYTNDLGIGEIYLTSIDCSGLARGYDLKVLKYFSDNSRLPIIASGGAGNANHFLEALTQSNVSAVSTSNLFNFMSDGLKEARISLINNDINLSKWLNFVL